MWLDEGPPQGKVSVSSIVSNDPCPNKKDLRRVMLVGLCREVGIGRVRISESPCLVSVLRNCHGRDHFSIEMTDGGAKGRDNIDSQ
jgi:hypothetical protein